MSIAPHAPWPGARSALGEAPCWRDGALHWVDIRAGRVWRGRLGEPAESVLDLRESVSAVLPASDGSFLVTGRHTIYHWGAAGIVPIVRLPDEPPGNRCNEARCDPWGNLWFSTMDGAGQRASGALWCLTREGEVEKVVDAMVIPNTLVWDPLRARLYLADSARRALDVFDFDAATRTPSGQRAFVRPQDAPGVPDGSALDDEGQLWNARWDGGCVIRIAPSGRIVETLAVPAVRPTSCAFGEGDCLFVTTALPDDANAKDPADGALLVLRTSVGGRPADVYDGPTRAADIRVTRRTALASWCADQ